MAYLPFELRRAFLAEGGGTFLAVLAAGDALELVALGHEVLGRTARQGLVGEVAQRADHQRRGIGDDLGHAPRFLALFTQRHDLVDEADVIGALDGDLFAQEEEFHGNFMRHARHDARHQAAEHTDLGLGVHEPWWCRPIPSGRRS